MVSGGFRSGRIMASRTSTNPRQQPHPRSLRATTSTRVGSVRPAAAYRQRGPVGGGRATNTFNAPEIWHEPQNRTQIEYIFEPAGAGFIHPLSIEDVRQRLTRLPANFVGDIQVIQFSGITRKRQLFPLYGMQWGPNVYLYPMESSLIERYRHPPTPPQIIEAKMFGGKWFREGGEWFLQWTPETIRDFYLNNVLIHEIGHVNDTRNTNSAARERYANWFATEYGFRVSRGRV
jgi:hypothetical protein